MSQQKVDQYKEYKKNRKEHLEKEKKRQSRNAMLGRLVAAVVILGLAVAIGITVYNGIRQRALAAPDYNRDQLVISDVAGIFATTVAEEETTAAPESTEAGQTDAADETTAADTETTTAAPETTTAAP